MSMTSLANKVAVVTGGGRGLGLAFSTALAEAGASVLICDNGSAPDGSGCNPQVAEDAAANLRRSGLSAVAFCCDISGSDGARAVVGKTLAEFGRIDILINNAGFLRDKTALKMSDEDFDAVVEVHLKAAFRLSREVGRVFKEQASGGRIVNITSLAGLIGNFGQSNYGSAKAAVAALTRILALEFAKMNVTVNAIAPVAFTRMTENLARFQDRERAMLAPELINPLLLFLVSDKASGVTGKIIGAEGNHYFEYVTLRSEGITLEGGWTPEAVSDKWNSIVGIN